MDKFQDKNLLCDVFDAFFYDSNDNLVFMSENLTASDIKGSADEKEVRNGKGNGLFAKLYSNKKIDITLKTNAFDFATVAMLAGTSVGTGNGTCYTPSLTLMAKTGGIVVLPNTPKYSTKVEIYLDGNKIDATKLVYTKNSVTITGVSEGKEVKVMPYEFDMPTGDDEYKEITIGANSFASAGKLVLKGIEKNKLTKIYKDLTIIIPQAQPASDFSLSTSSQVEATETEIKLSALVDNGRLMKIIETPHIEQNDWTFDVISSISNLASTSTVATKADLTFTAPTGATSVVLQYKETSGSTWSDVTVGGSTGVRIATALSATSNSVNVSGLTAATSYDFKLVIVGGIHEGTSNTSTIVSV